MNGFTYCNRCDCVYSSLLKPEGSVCDDLSNAFDHFPVDADPPTEEELLLFQCKGICS